MIMNILFLGTGAGVPSKGRNVTSSILQMPDERGASWMFDCGEATQHQILHTTVKPKKIEKIFITHMHGDHIFGLPGFLSSRSFQGGEEELTVYGPVGIKEYVLSSLRLSMSFVKYPLSFVEFEEDGIIFEDEHCTVTVKKVVHGIPSYGYRIEEKPKKGRLLVEKLAEEGLKPGPQYKLLKETGRLELEDGRVLLGEDYISEDVEGKRVAIIGDTRYTEASIELAANCDLVVHEATFSDAESKHAHEYFHSTSTQAATIAKNAEAKKLVITHISSRYQGAESSQLIEEAQKIFPNTKLANDFSVFSI